MKIGTRIKSLVDTSYVNGYKLDKGEKGTVVGYTQYPHQEEQYPLVVWDGDPEGRNCQVRHAERYEQVL